MNREMKNSNIPWIGCIPASWTTCLIKQVMRNKSIKGYPNETVLSLYREYGVIPKDSRTDNHNTTSEDTSNYKFVEVGDFVVNKMKAWQGSMAVSEYQGIISPAYYICRFVSNDVYKRYIHYLLRNETYKAEYMRLSSGLRVGQWDLNIEDFLRIPMVLPLYTEQKAIADFLDKKCGEIDELVALQEKIIEELKSYKQSVITETVCKGLNPNAPMKDSEVECIGMVPEKWNVVLLPFVFRNLDYLREPISAEQRSRINPMYDYYGASGVIDKIDYYNVDDDVLLIGEDGANLKMRNLPLIYRATGKFWVNNHAHILKPIKDNIVYMQYMLEALDYNTLITGSAQPKLSQDNLSKVRVCVPPLGEQQEIADYLDTKCSEIDQLISIKQQKIVELKEYKKSLIYEYTTGKKEVKL